MSRNLERALETLDVGEQHSGETGYGADDPDRCARCLGEPPVDGDLCPGCRAFLLGDSDDDPAEPEPVTFLGDPTAGAFQRAVHAEMQRLSTELLNRTLYGNPDGPPAESRLTGLGAILDNDRSYSVEVPPVPISDEEVPYAVSYLTIPDRSRHAPTLFEQAQQENVAELRAQGWDGLYFHRRMAERRPPGATSTRWTIMTRGYRLGR